MVWKKYRRLLAKSGNTFPISEKSQNPFFSLRNWIEPKVSLLLFALTVDASVMQLAKYVTLSMEDPVTLKDALDHKIDLDLKCAYMVAGGACSPAITLAAVRQAVSS